MTLFGVHASSGRLALVLQRLHSTSSQCKSPLRHSDPRRRLRGLAVGLHANRPRVSLGVIGFTGGLLGALAGVFSVDLSAPIRPPQMTSRDLVPMAGVTAPLAPAAMGLGIDAANSGQALRIGQAAGSPKRPTFNFVLESKRPSSYQRPPFRRSFFAIQPFGHTCKITGHIPSNQRSIFVRGPPAENAAHTSE
jgi:hypothetical protein